MSVFGALNRFISRLDSDGPPGNPRSTGNDYGFQVLRNKNQELSLEPWFDFIVGINGRQIDNPDPYLFSTEVQNCAGSTVLLTLWNAKGQRIRNIHLAVPSSSEKIGLTLQWTPLTSTSSIWHILDVIANSPADLAGLLPYGDYIIGSPEGTLRGEGALGELVEDFLARPLRLFVYNNEYDVTRLLTITPSRSWGGEGALGCVLGYGALHQIPPPLEEPPAAEGETLFETARISTDVPSHTIDPVPAAYPIPNSDSFVTSNLITPASMPAPPPLLSATSTLPTRGPRKGRASPAKGFDEMFAEGEAKSKEQDFTPSKTSTTVAPPPKKTLAPPQPIEARSISPDTQDSDDVG